jgi:hypothetical protein
MAFESLAERLQRSQSRAAGHLAIYIHRHRDLANRYFGIMCAIEYGPTAVRRTSSEGFYLALTS